MSFLFREGGCDDIAAILAMDQAHSPVFSRAESYERLLGKPGLLTVAEEEQAVIGFAACSMVLDEASLLNITVLPQARRRGVARALLGEVMQRLAQAGAGRLFLEVRESNQGARSLYAFAGFSCDGERAGYYRSHRSDAAETAILMSRQLGNTNAGT